MNERRVIRDASSDPSSDIAQDIEVFAQLVMEYARGAVDGGTIASAHVPEGLLLAAVELAARHEDGPDGVAAWLERVAARLREHIEPAVSPGQ